MLNLPNILEVVEHFSSTYDLHEKKADKKIEALENK